jgi:hypothetical protein
VAIPRMRSSMSCSCDGFSGVPSVLSCDFMAIANQDRNRWAHREEQPVVVVLTMKFGPMDLRYMKSVKSIWGYARDCDLILEA